MSSNYNTKKELQPARISELPFEYLLYLNTEAGFGGSSEREERFLISANRTLLEIENAYALASLSYNLPLVEQCTDIEDNKFSEDFRKRLEAAIPVLYWREGQRKPGEADYPPVDFDCIERKDFVYIYMLIARLANPEIQFQFIQFKSASIGGAGLFYFN
jgi:hypothetical protein